MGALPGEDRENAVAIGRREYNGTNADAGLEIDLLLESQGKSAKVRAASRPGPVYNQGRALNLARLDDCQRPFEGDLFFCRGEAG